MSPGGSDTHRNLLATGAPETRLPVDPAAADLAAGGAERLGAVLRSHPTSSLCWAVLAEDALGRRTDEDDVAGYAYARTGYHRGLDALRQAGWRGQGPVPWVHEPNRGFLRALAALAMAAGRIGEEQERVRCTEFLRASSMEAARELGL